MQQCSDFYFLNYFSQQCLASSRDLLERKVEISSHSQAVLKNDWCMTRRAGLYICSCNGVNISLYLTALGPGSQEIISKRNEKRDSVAVKSSIFNLFFFFFFLNYDLGS